MVTVRGTTVDLDGHGALLRGPPGCGKSDLALRLIDGGARLVADDYTELAVREGRLVASAPQTIAGLIEVRGIGIVAVESAAETILRCVVELVAKEAVERSPEPGSCEMCGQSVPLFRLDPFAASAAAKVRLLVKVAIGLIIPIS